jgi:hypothetical protein
MNCRAVVCGGPRAEELATFRTPFTFGGVQTLLEDCDFAARVPPIIGDTHAANFLARSG